MLTESLFLPTASYYPHYEANVFDEPDVDYYTFPNSFLSPISRRAALQDEVERESRRNINQGHYEKDLYYQMIQRQREIEEQNRYKTLMLAMERERQDYEVMLERERERKLREFLQRQAYEKQRQAEARRAIQRRQALAAAELKEQKQREDSMCNLLASSQLPQTRCQSERDLNLRGAKRAIPVHIIRQMKAVNASESSSPTRNHTSPVAAKIEAESKMDNTSTTPSKPAVQVTSSILIGGVEDVPMEEWDGDRPDAIWNNRRPSEGNWMEPVEACMGWPTMNKQL